MHAPLKSHFDITLRVLKYLKLAPSEPANETDTKSYSIEGFAWAFNGQLPVQRLVPDETEARSRWWVSSRAYFDGRSFEEEQIPSQLNQNNSFEVPSEMYQDFEEQSRGYQQLKENNADMYEKLTRFIENTRRVPEAHTTPIIADQHFGVSDMSGFQSYQPGTSNWQNQMPSHRQDAGILDPNLCDRARREPQPSVYMLSPYTNLPPT
nr:hypothetical protein [Tanacetum cinerariifolium]